MTDVPIPEKYRSTTFQLTLDSVSPTRLVSRNEEGFDVEETISCYPHTEMFVDRAGNLCQVVLCNSRTTARNSEARNYAASTREDWIRANGLPLTECPHAPSGEYTRMIGTATLVAPPKDYKPCTGAPDGCVHLKALIEKRLLAQLKRTEKDENAQLKLTGTQLEQMGKTFGTQIADAIADQRAHLRSNRGEKD